MYRGFLLLIVVLLAWSCQPKKENRESSPGQLAAEQARLEPRPSFIINIDDLRLRDAAGPDAEIVATLDKGTRLYDLGEVSDFTTAVSLRGIRFNEPWIKVETESGQQGWVYGGALNFELNEDHAAAALLMQKRLTTLFGLQMRDSLMAYNASYTRIKSQEGFERVYEQGIKLRDRLNRDLEQRVDFSGGAQVPDLFWLEEAFPGFEAQLVAEGTAYQLFANYKDWGMRALLTPGDKDDAFVEIKYLAYPEDSIGYYFPAWTIQTWDYGGHSLLGRGTHHTIMERMEQLWAPTGLFSDALIRTKNELVADITGSTGQYWEKAEQVRSELRRIIESDFSFLTPEDHIALQTRLQQLEEPERYDIRTNYQSGMYQ